MNLYTQNHLYYVEKGIFIEIRAFVTLSIVGTFGMVKQCMLCVDCSIVVMFGYAQINLLSLGEKH